VLFLLSQATNLLQVPDNLPGPSFIIIIITTTIIIGKLPFLSHSLPSQILPDLSIPLQIRPWILQQQFFYGANSSALHPTLNLEDQVSVFISPSDRVAQLYHQVWGSRFVAFYDLQGYGGGILTCPHTGHTIL
jgi:hypothetical protein